jgi:carbonic anhydrase/acetyltransferase-like protein (isoleucine patch superfamily)
MAELLPERFLGGTPSVDPDAFVAAGARIVGEVRLEAGASIWFNCVLRADLAAVSVGRNSNLQDGTLVHVETGRPCRIADHVTVGHGAILHACTVESGCLMAGVPARLVRKLPEQTLERHLEVALKYAEAGRRHRRLALPEDPPAV